MSNLTLRQRILKTIAGRQQPRVQEKPRAPRHGKPPPRQPADRPVKKPPTTGGGSPGDSGDAACMASCAEDQVGKRYVWATHGPNTFDCSGMIAFCYERCTGKTMSYSSYDQARLGTQVTGALRQGDILYYGNGSHVGLVTGENRAVHALNENAGVVVAEIPGNMGLVYNGARRIFAERDRREAPPLRLVATPGSGIGAPTGTVPHGKIGGGGDWSQVNQFDPIFVAEGRKHNIDPAIGKSAMLVETGGKDVSDPFGASGVLQFKKEYWGDRARAAGYDLETAAGQIGMLFAILGGNLPGLRGDTILERFFYNFYPILNADGSICWDCRGESGHTPQMYRDDIEFYMGLIKDAEGSAPALPPQPPAAGDTSYRPHAVAGSDRPLYLPHWLGFRQRLTPLGVINQAVGLPNRSGEHMDPTVTVFHTTNNANVGRDAADHAQWQANGTLEHPDGVVAVHFYVDAGEAIQTLPIDEVGIHSGDWRNQWGIAVERTCNADQVQAEAENNAMHVHAGLLWIIGKTAREAMYPHTQGGHCPRLIKPWPEVERITDMRIERIEGQHHA